MHDLTLSIISHGHVADVVLLLKDIQEHVKKNIKIIITLNIPEHNTLLKDFPFLQIKIIQNQSPKGFAENHNQAFKVSKSTYFAVINPDIRLNSTDPFKNLLSFLSNNSNSGIATPIILNQEGSQEDFIRKNLTPLSLIKKYMLHKKRLNESISKDDFFWIAGMFMVFNSEIYKEINGFDTRFFLYCEDCDICIRLFLKNYTLNVVKDISVIHNAHRSSHKSLKYLVLHITSLFRLWFSFSFLKLNIKLFKRRIIMLK
jgi:GT2 family glycosyltransferase